MWIPANSSKKANFVRSFENLAWTRDGTRLDEHVLEQDSPPTRFSRQLGPTELSYYLATRGEGDESGVNDMYLHVGFRAKASLMTASHLLDIWTELTIRHPLLASRVVYDSPERAYFVHETPASRKDARNRAENLIALIAGHDHRDLLDDYLNGPRTLSDNRLSFLVVSTPDDPSANEGDKLQQYHFMLFSTHFIGDGMALHATANEFFELLSQPAGSDPATSEEQSLKSSDGISELHFSELPPALESDLAGSTSASKLAWAAARIDFKDAQRRQVGGHELPRRKIGPRHTVVPTISFDTAKTKQILSNCKAHGTTISNAIISLINLAYIRINPTLDNQLPMLLYSAMSIRSQLKSGQADRQTQKDHYKLAISYYNVILPSFLPSTASISETFWARCHAIKAQTSSAVKSPFLKYRAILTALERETRSIGFAQEDERKNAKANLIGLGLEIPKLVLKPSAAIEVKEAPKEVSKAVPNKALMGVSMLGNLDAVYAHKTYQGIELESLTTGSRQRPGALLLFAYTFAGKLWLSLGFDRNGFEPGSIEAFWSELQLSANELLL